MDLTRMNREELNRLQGALSVIGTAADVLAEGGLTPEISLTCEETVLRAAPILSRGVPSPMPAPVLIEDVPGPLAGFADSVAEVVADALPPLVAAAPVERLLEATQDVDAMPVQAPAPEKVPAHVVLVPPKASVRAAPPPAVGPVLGPLSAEERCRILDLDRQGVSRGEIAKALNRRIQAVALFLTAQLAEDGRMTHRDAPPPADGVVAAANPEPTAGIDPGPVPATAAEPVPAPVAQSGAGIDPPAAEPGPVPAVEPGFVHVGKAAAQVVAAAEAARVVAHPVPAPPAAVVPADLKGPDRDIWDHLARVPMPQKWDSELDLDMVEGFARGTKAGMLASDLGCDSKFLVDRYRLITAPIRDSKGNMSIEGQVRFLKVLRARVLTLRGKVA